jgi:K+-transporting ATPase ATPase C chain
VTAVFRSLSTALRLFVLLALLTGIVYPFVTLGLARLLFPHESRGSLLHWHGRVVGSALIGQEIRGRRYFWTRPSATTPVPYDADASNASNTAPTNPVLVAHIRRRVARLEAADPDAHGPIPIDLVTTSGSGLDPDISLAAAAYQIPRVARAGGLSPRLLEKLVRAYTRRPPVSFLGPPVVAVLPLDLALHRLYAQEKNEKDRTPSKRQTPGPAR